MTASFYTHISKTWTKSIKKLLKCGIWTERREKNSHCYWLINVFGRRFYYLLHFSKVNFFLKNLNTFINTLKSQIYNITFQNISISQKLFKNSYSIEFMDTMSKFIHLNGFHAIWMNFTTVSNFGCSEPLWPTVYIVISVPVLQ